MADTIQLKGGIKANMPPLADRELVIVRDEKALYVGTGSGSMKMCSADDRPFLDGHVQDNVHHITAAERTAWNGKANKATTLAGYGIADAYTKAEVDQLIADLRALITE